MTSSLVSSIWYSASSMSAVHGAGRSTDGARSQSGRDTSSLLSLGLRSISVSLPGVVVQAGLVTSLLSSACRCRVTSTNLLRVPGLCLARPNYPVTPFAGRLPFRSLASSYAFLVTGCLLPPPLAYPCSGVFCASLSCMFVELHLGRLLGAARSGFSSTRAMKRSSRGPPRRPHARTSP